MRHCIRAIAVVIAILAFPLSSGAQSSGGLVNLSAPRGKDANANGQGEGRENADPAAATRSYYLGTQVGYSFTENGEFASGLVASGSVLYRIIDNPSKDAKTYRFYLPVRGNLSSLTVPLDDAGKSKLSTLVSSPGGMQVAVEPYVLLPEVGANLHPQVFASAGWRLSSAKDASDTTRYLPQGRVVLGGALGIGPSEGGTYPLWLEVAGAWTKFANDSYKQILGTDASSKATALIGTVIAPVAQHAAVLTEVYATKGERPVWRVGLVLMGGEGK